MKRKRQSPAHRSQERILQETGVYVFHNFPYFWINKFGISDNTKARRQNVSETAPGYVFCVFAPKLIYGWECEQFVHTLYAWLNVPFAGSGKSEWMLVFSPAVGTLFLFGADYLINPAWWAYPLAYFTPFVWWDGLLWLLIFAAARILLYGALLMIVVYLISHLKP